MDRDRGDVGGGWNGERKDRLVVQDLSTWGGTSGRSAITERTVRGIAGARCDGRVATGDGGVDPHGVRSLRGLTAGHPE